MSTTPTQINCDVKNLDLADMGKKRIDWANQSMNVLQIIRKEFIKNQPLKGVRISACLHVTAETANLAVCLRDGGADVVLCASNPLSTQDDVAASLVRDYNVPVYAIKGEDNETYYQHIVAAIDHRPQITMDDGADRAVSILIGNDKALPVAARAVLFGTFYFLQGIPAFLGEKILLVHQFNAVFFGERFCALAIHHDVPGFFHHQPGKSDGVFDMFQRSDCAGSEGFPVHNSSIHLVGSGACEHGAPACIKMRIVFERSHCGFRRVETRATALENFVAGIKRSFKPSAVFTLALRGHLAWLDSPGAAVDRDSNFFRFHAWLIVWFSRI